MNGRIVRGLSIATGAAFALTFLAVLVPAAAAAPAGGPAQTASLQPGAPYHGAAQAPVRGLTCLTTVTVSALPAVVSVGQPSLFHTSVSDLQLGALPCNVPAQLTYLGLPAGCAGSTAFVTCQTSQAGTFYVTVIAVEPWGTYTSAAAVLTVVP